MDGNPEITTKTTVSTRTQVVLPAAMHRRLGRDAGTRLTVEETAQGVLLKAKSPFPPTRMEDVHGSAHYDGSPVSIKDMDKAIEHPVAFSQALECLEEGMDFADAMHLAGAAAEVCEALATFDRKFAAGARKARAGKVRAL